MGCLRSRRRLHVEEVPTVGRGVPLVKHPDYLKAMQKLQLSGFRVVHLHGNNYASMFDTTDYKIPQVVEVTFDSSAQPMTTCLQDQQMRPLDMPNNAGNAELPLAHLPSF